MVVSDTPHSRVLSSEPLDTLMLRLGENLDSLNPAVQSFLDQAQARFLQQTGDPATAQQLAHALENLRQQRASALSYFDGFWLSIVMRALTLVVFLMKCPLAEKGARIAGK